MNEPPSRFDQLVGGILPIAFVGSGYLNALVFPLGLHAHDTLRTLVTFGIIGAVALLLLAKTALLWRGRPDSRKAIACAALIPVLFGLAYLWALLTVDSPLALMKTLVTNGCYLVSCCCALVIIWQEDRLQAFLRTCRIYSAVISPLILYYCVRFYRASASWGVQNLGVLNYMALAYLLLELGFFLFLEVFLYGSSLSRGVRQLSGALYGLFAAAIALSGTKGTILCLLFGSVLVVVFSWIYPPRHLRFPLTALVVTVLFLTVLFPTGDGVPNRVTSFLGELTPEGSVSMGAEEVDQISGILSPSEEEGSAESAPEVADVVELVNSGKAEQMLLAGELTQEEFETLQEMARRLNNTSTGARSYLWTCAVKEIKTAPLTGQGPFSYQDRYGTYPHNFFLEIATDFGLPAMLFVLLLGAAVFLRLILQAKHSRPLLAFLLYVFTFLPQNMVSGSLYSYTAFFQYGFCLVFVFFAGKNLSKPHKELTTHEAS